MRNIKIALTVSGFIYIMLILIGAIANAYGAHVQFIWLLDSSTFILIFTYLCVLIYQKLSRPGW